MSLINEIVDKAKIAVDFAGEKTDDFFNLTKANWAIAETENELTKLYAQIGKCVYSSMRTSDDYSEQIAAVAATIDEKVKKLNDLRERVEKLKKMKKCPNCATANASDFDY